MSSSDASGGEQRHLRVLVLSSLYPNAAFDRMGEVTERQTRWLASLPDVYVEVVAPVLRYPFPLSSRNPSPLPPHEHWNGVPVHRPTFTVIPKWRSTDAALLARSTLPIVAEIHRLRPIDIIAAQYFWPDGPAAMKLAQKLGVALSIKGRGPDFLRPARQRSKRKQILSAAQAADGVLAVSSGLREEMARAGVPPERIKVHYTGADHGSFHCEGRVQAKEELGLLGTVLLVAGNLSRRKGQLTAIEALAHVNGATLLIAGRGPEEAKLRQRVEELGLQDRVRFLGLVDHASMPLLNRAADVAVLPSKAEGLANVWIEALCCGTPVVTTDVCGAREVINEAAAGRIVADDPLAIARGIREILDDSPVPERVAKAAEKFDWVRSAVELRQHLREAVQHRLSQKLSEKP